MSPPPHPTSFNADVLRKYGVTSRRYFTEKTRKFILFVTIGKPYMCRVSFILSEKWRRKGVTMCDKHLVTETKALSLYVLCLLWAFSLVAIRLRTSLLMPEAMKAIHGHLFHLQTVWPRTRLKGQRKVDIELVQDIGLKIILVEFGKDPIILQRLIMLTCVTYLLC